MKKIKVIIESGYTQVPDRIAVIEVDDDADDNEIREAVENEIFNMISWDYEEIE